MRHSEKMFLFVSLFVCLRVYIYAYYRNVYMKIVCLKPANNYGDGTFAF